MELIAEDVWRSGNLLVMRKGAQLPDRCIKTNQPANGKRFKATLYWHPPAIYFLLLLNLMIYMLVAIAVRKKAVVYVGVIEAILQERRRAILLCWSAGIAGIFLFIFSLSLSPQSGSVMGLMLFLSVGLILGGVIGGITKATLVNVVRIEREYVWIRGVASEYLALLPEWESMGWSR